MAEAIRPRPWWLGEERAVDLNLVLTHRIRKCDYYEAICMSSNYFGAFESLRVDWEYTADMDGSVGGWRVQCFELCVIVNSVTRVWWLTHSPPAWIKELAM